MPPADPRDGADTGDDDDDTVIVQRTDNHDTVIVQRTDNDDTVIVQRATDERTRIVARARHARPEAVDPAVEPAVDLAVDPLVDPAADPEDDGEATVRSPRGSAASDTLLSSRRATPPARIPVVDDLQRRYQPPQVQSGASVRYQARPVPIIVAPAQPTPGSPPIAPDPARIALAEAAAEIRQRAAAGIRRRRQITLVAIIASTLLALVAAVGFTVFALATW
ncbi:hypothetical protein E3T46_15295 [Cryobacterium sp. Hh11]|uniref:hypothetical protein n=1 Tax=Cryobacterium sp. Hh11 TaxID=2555868 RepID=UPI00106D0F4B|nr:hypothetical protein [Cryobacterium sp. Hh11]TFD48406.1 hypothetical protein E3T46_15295 [Cryobacterium sp. Hh11]